MIEYEMKRIPKVEGFVMTEFEYKIVSKSELYKYAKDGWTLHRKKYFILTYFFDLWLSLNTDQKIAVIAILTASLIGVVALF